MHLGLIVGSTLLLAGCAAIPPAVSIATWAIDGTTLAISGKTVSDHAISAVTQRDCAMWRLLKGEPVCADHPAEAGPVGPVQAAVAPPPAPPEPAKPDLASAPPPAVTAEPDGAIHLASFAPAPAPRLGAASGRSAPVVEAQEAVLNIAPTTPPEPAAPAPSADTRLVSIGSYAVAANAHERVAEHESLRPFIIEAVVDGQPLLRVVVGPFEAEALDAALARLRLAGVADPWVLPADAGAPALRMAARDAARGAP
jgi:hypothetical protein